MDGERKLSRRKLPNNVIMLASMPSGHDECFGLRLNPNLVNALDIKKGTTLYWGIDKYEWLLYCTTKKQENSTGTRVFTQGNVFMIVLPMRLGRTMELHTGDLFKWKLNLKKKRIELIPIEVETPYITQIENTRKAYHGAPPRESVVELIHKKDKY